MFLCYLPLVIGPIPCRKIKDLYSLARYVRPSQFGYNLKCRLSLPVFESFPLLFLSLANTRQSLGNHNDNYLHKRLYLGKALFNTSRTFFFFCSHHNCWHTGRKSKLSSHPKQARTTTFMYCDVFPLPFFLIHQKCPLAVFPLLCTIVPIE
jgi:hypothetical protein